MSSNFNPADTRSIDDWFVAEILPLERLLYDVLRRNWRHPQDIPDLRQEIYVRIFESARVERPVSAIALLLTITRNLLIDRARRAQVVSIETVADLDELSLLIDELTPERYAMARGDLRTLQEALEALPQRCREVVQLVRIAGLSQREAAQRLKMTEDSVEKQLARGIRSLVNALTSAHAGLPVALVPGRARPGTPDS